MQDNAIPFTDATLFIKNMVCNRCVRAVQEALQGLGLPVRHVGLGQALIGLEYSRLDLPAVRHALEKQGFELLEDARAQRVERMKAEVISLVQSDGMPALKTNLSEYLAGKLGKDYAGLSALFSSVAGITLERYAILQKMERAKELLAYGELAVGEIAYRLGYSSGAHLTTQFRQETGFTPTQFRKLDRLQRQRLPLDEVGRP